MYYLRERRNELSDKFVYISDVNMAKNFKKISQSSLFYVLYLLYFQFAHLMPEMKSVLVYIKVIIP